MVYYLITLLSKSKIRAIFIQCFLCIGLLAIFKLSRTDIIFSEIDVFQEIYGNGLNILNYIIINVKYISYIYLISLLCEVLENRKDLLS